MPLAKQDANWRDYVSHLQILARWLVPLELWLAKYHDGPQSALAPEFILYSNFIMRDLGQAFIPQVNEAKWPTQENAAYRWGIAYVIEGSQLGGEFLYKRLSSRLAPEKLSYLQTKQSGRWPIFLQALAANVITTKEIDSACAGAMDAFDALLQQLPVRE